LITATFFLAFIAFFIAISKLTPSSKKIGAAEPLAAATNSQRASRRASSVRAANASLREPLKVLLECP
jgi:hypothetical protein